MALKRMPTYTTLHSVEKSHKKICQKFAIFFLFSPQLLFPSMRLRRTKFSSQNGSQMQVRVDYIN